MQVCNELGTYEVYVVETFIFVLNVPVRVSDSARLHD